MALLSMTVLMGACAAKSTLAKDGGAPDAAQETATAFNPGDAVRIRVPLDTASFLNGEYPIDDQGNVFLPMVGQKRVSSLSSVEFERYLQATYQQHLRYTEIQVQPLIRVGMLGGFAQPGMYYVSPSWSLWEVIHKAGGTPHETGLRRLRWERDRKIVERNLIPYLESGQSLHSIGIKSGDQLWTPAREPKGFWDAAVREFLIRDILPLSTFALSLFVTIMSLRDN